MCNLQSEKIRRDLLRFIKGDTSNECMLINYEDVDDDIAVHCSCEREVESIWQTWDSICTV